MNQEGDTGSASTLDLHEFENVVVDPQGFWCPKGQSHDRLVTVSEGGADVVSCPTCGHRVEVTNQIIEFVVDDALDAHKTKELSGNEISLDDETIRHYLQKEEWSAFYRHFSLRKIDILAKWLARADISEVAFLGVGTGYEVGLLWRAGFHPGRMLLSDLNRSTLEVAKFNLRAQGVSDDVEVCLFTSDLDDVPIRDTDVPLVVYECLHHTPDMHATLEQMMIKGYRNVYFVEPSTNWLIRFLANRGLAQREEYSGLDPDRLDLGVVRDLCETHGYRLESRTMWELPEDYYRKLARGDSDRKRQIFTRLIDATSEMGRPFKFGNFAICHLSRTSE